ncbi:FG-GAP-like repeat-containing protein [Taibaiella koreensis]|uniref:FG-GAP-like repeat-containing protein n=1 Tax=Taibaiella koreensis TaxID=1268548 RepID=UPI0013C36037|nr:FG-GAP-like repeat-containing protein [Taibaiella koreensis]
MRFLYTMRYCLPVLLLLLSVSGFAQTQFSIVPSTLNMTMAFRGRQLFGDFDKDGDVDVLYQSANNMGQGFGYMKNNGSGTFTNYPNANVAGTPFATLNLTHQQISTASMFVFDYDHDGDVDIVDRDSVGGGEQDVWVNNNGVFQYAAGNPLPMTMAFGGRLLYGDFDNDGDIDVLYQSSNVMGAGFGYMKSNGNGTFTSYTNANTAGTPFATLDLTHQQIATATMFVFDYDHDGDDDIVDRDSAGNGALGVWVNNSGVFQYAASNPFTMTMAFSGRLLYGDFDSDGDVDLLYQASNTAGAGFGYMKNGGNGTYTDYPNANVAGTPFTSFNFANQQLASASMFVYDYDNDGDVDIVDQDTTGGTGMWTVAGSPPRLVSSNPANGAVNVSTTANLVLTFSEPVVSAGGNMYIRRTADNSIFETIAIGGAAVSGLNTTTITVNPVGNLSGSTGYYLTFDATAFRDNEGHLFGEIPPGDFAVAPIRRNNFIAFTTGTALPVTLLSFTAQKQGTAAVLDWETASELHAAYFEVQYSTDGKNYTSLDQVACKGGEGLTASYHYVHAKPGAGKAYYRLKQVDLDGQAMYSPVQQLFFEQEGLVQVHPNPVSGRLSVDVVAGNYQQVQLSDISGKVWYHMAIAAEAHHLELDLSNRAAGVYLLQLKGASGDRVIRILKQ